MQVTTEPASTVKSPGLRIFPNVNVLLARTASLSADTTLLIKNIEAIAIRVLRIEQARLAFRFSVLPESLSTIEIITIAIQHGRQNIPTPVLIPITFPIKGTCAQGINKSKTPSAEPMSRVIL